MLEYTTGTNTYGYEYRLEWTPAHRLPPAGKPVLAHVVGLRNDGSGVIVRASYWPAHTLQASDDYGSDFGEYDEETDEYWSPAGWYEVSEVECPQCGDIYYAHIDGSRQVTHWMPMPAKPEVGGG